MSEGLHVRRLVRGDRSRALECLRARPDENLSLIDYACRLDGTLGPGEVPPQLYGAFEGDRIEAIVALRPSVVFSSGMTDDAQSVLMPLVVRVPNGLIKSEHTLVNSIWSALEAAGREAVIDRVEIAYRLRPEAILPADPELPGVARPAREEDLEDLIHAARASLWEEDRPDPSDGCAVGCLGRESCPRTDVLCSSPTQMCGRTKDGSCRASTPGRIFVGEDSHVAGWILLSGKRSLAVPPTCSSQSLMATSGL
jgi:hypothetical protein